MKKLLLCLLLCAGTVHAQVNRCVNPKTGAVTYSDTLCDTSQKRGIKYITNQSAKCSEIDFKID